MIKVHLSRVVKESGTILKTPALSPYQTALFAVSFTHCSEFACAWPVVHLCCSPCLRFCVSLITVTVCTKLACFYNEFVYLYIFWKCVLLFILCMFWQFEINWNPWTICLLKLPSPWVCEKKRDVFLSCCLQSPFYYLNLSVQSSQIQYVMAAESNEDHVYRGLETLQAALRCAAGRRAGFALPGSTLLLFALRAQPQALQHCWVEHHTLQSWHTHDHCMSPSVPHMSCCMSLLSCNCL